MPLDRPRLAAWSLLLLPGLLCVLLPGSAYAVEREGFIFGGSAGGGWVQCDDCDTLGGLSVGFYTGWMLRERLAVVVDGLSVMHPQTLRSPFLQSTIVGIGARYFFRQRLWVQVVFGIGRRDSTAAVFLSNYETGEGGMAGVGVEILQKRKFVVDLSARMGGYGPESGDVKNVSLQIGLNFY